MNAIRSAIALTCAFSLTASLLGFAPEPQASAVATGTVRTSARIDDAHYKIARRVIERAIAYLRTQQDEKTGGWSVPEAGKPNLPGISALVLTGMLMEPDIDSDDPTVARGVEYLLSFRKPDGGIYDSILSNYNTSLALSALARINRPDAVAAIKPAQDFLRSLQCDGSMGPDGKVIDRSHPYYGGTGYTADSRPDNSNLATMLQGLHDSGLDCNDPAFQKAVNFLQRTQMVDALNDLAYADGSNQGGFIYSTSPSNTQVGIGESKAGMIDETMDDGTVVSRLRCYGSMTYSGFKSYLYANLSHDDPRVVAAHDWLLRYYTLDENPGVGQQGYYYYLVTLSRSLNAWGSTTLTPFKADGTPGESRDWANDLIDKLASLQKPDGRFVNDTDRWMEGDPILATSYALLALQNAID